MTVTSRVPDHTFRVNVLDDNTVRVLSYSPSNSTFNGNDGPLFTLDVKADHDLWGNGVVTVTNVVFSDSNYLPYYANDSQSLMTTTGVDDVTTGHARVWSSNGTLIIESAQACEALLSDMSGKAVTLAVQAGHNEWDGIGNGVWIVRIAGQSHKVIIK